MSICINMIRFEMKITMRLKKLRSQSNVQNNSQNNIEIIALNQDFLCGVVHDSCALDWEAYSKIAATITR